MKKTILAVIIGAFALAGCASSGEYEKYLAAQEKIAFARSASETARYNALAKIAESGDAVAKVAAVITINATAGAQQPTQQLNAPVSNGQTALQWASILVPALTQTAGIVTNASVMKLQSNNQTQSAIVQSNNNAQVHMNTNQTMRDIANLITVPEPVIVTQPAPVIVTQPAPIIVEPVIVQPTTP